MIDRLYFSAHCNCYTQQASNLGLYIYCLYFILLQELFHLFHVIARLHFSIGLNEGKTLKYCQETLDLLSRPLLSGLNAHYLLYLDYKNKNLLTLMREKNDKIMKMITINVHLRLETFFF